MSSTSESSRVDPGEPAADVSRDPDALLQATRRVDWRFLLDRPELERVAYVGPSSGELLRSARLFSAVLCTANVGESPTGNDPTLAGVHDVAIAVEPCADQLPALRALLRSGGALYLEGRHVLARSRVARGQRPAHAAAWAKALRDAGFERIRAFWIWPDFERCSEVVPLAERAALLHALGRRQRDWRARTKAFVVTCAVRCGWMPRLAPCFALIGYRPTGERTSQDADVSEGARTT